MGRMRVLAGLVMAALVLVGCGELLDDLELSEEQASDLEAFEDFVEEAASAAEAAQEAQDGGGDGEGDQPEFESDPDWSPPDFPPPPDLEPDLSLSEDSDCGTADCFPCQDGRQCGYAEYEGEDLQDVLDHYEEIFGRPPDDEVDWGVNEDRTDYRWEDDDAFVEVSDNRDDDETEVYVAQDDV